MSKHINFIYTNYKDIEDSRIATPISVIFKNSSHHGFCWILRAFCHNRCAVRDFKIEDMRDFGSKPFLIQQLAEIIERNK
jgi:predicted DNA-binding transcriptional regulator YafY